MHRRENLTQELDDEKYLRKFEDNADQHVFGVGHSVVQLCHTVCLNLTYQWRILKRRPCTIGEGVDQYVKVLEVRVLLFTPGI